MGVQQVGQLLVVTTWGSRLKSHFLQGACRLSGRQVGQEHVVALCPGACNGRHPGAQAAGHLPDSLQGPQIHLHAHAHAPPPTWLSCGLSTMRDSHLTLRAPT